jgi:hypothetical protein
MLFLTSSRHSVPAALPSIRCQAPTSWVVARMVVEDTPAQAGIDRVIDRP